MPDIAVISSVLSSVKTATDIAKLIKESGNRLEQAEFKLQLAELISALADAKIQMAEIQELVIEKDKKIKALEEEIQLKGNIEWDGTMYWLVEDGQRKDGPFCQRCYDVDKTLVRLQDWGDGVKVCMACEKNY